MKLFLRICAIAIAVVVLCAAAIVGSVEWLTRRSTRALSGIVAALPAGVPFSEATGRLGEPKRVLEDAEEIRSFAQQNGAAFIPGSKLYLFHHNGPPIRWVFVYVDSTSQRITHAEWREM